MKTIPYKPFHDPSTELDPVARRAHETNLIALYIVYEDDNGENFGVTRVTGPQYSCSMNGITRIGVHALIGHINVRAPQDITSPDTGLSGPFFFTSLIGSDSCEDTPLNRKRQQTIMQAVTYIKKSSLGTGLLPSVEESKANCKLSKSEWKKRSAAAKLLAFGPSAKQIVIDDCPLSCGTKKSIAAEKKLLSQFKARYLSGTAGEIFNPSIHTLSTLCYGFMIDLTKKLGRPCTECELKEWAQLQIKLSGIRKCTPKEIKAAKAAEAAPITNEQELEVYRELEAEGIIERVPGVATGSLLPFIPPTSKVEFKARLRRMFAEKK